MSKFKLLTASMLGLGLLSSVAMADVRIDINNDSTDDCSVAFNARVDKTKWVTLGWYVYMPGESAPVILKGVNDVKDVFIYHDCNMKTTDRDEVKRGWVNTNLKFTDYIPKDKEDGYAEVNFVRLTNSTYTIAPSS